ncbi:MAG: hypothetical protein AB1340_09590 [Pseudomonadota bacterium]
MSASTPSSLPRLLGDHGQLDNPFLGLLLPPAAFSHDTPENGCDSSCGESQCGEKKCSEGSCGRSDET